MVMVLDLMSMKVNTTRLQSPVSQLFSSIGTMCDMVLADQPKS